MTDVSTSCVLRISGAPCGRITFIRLSVCDKQLMLECQTDRSSWTSASDSRWVLLIFKQQLFVDNPLLHDATNGFHAKAHLTSRSTDLFCVHVRDLGRFTELPSSRIQRCVVRM
jgi:hypothetical protein